jgi:hypothetical protein
MPIPPDWSKNLREFVKDWAEATPPGGVVGKAPAGGEKYAEYAGDAPFLNFVLTEQAESWDQFLGWLNELRGSWCFRGQRDARWLLSTSLDRAVKREISGGALRTHLDREPEIRELLFRFQQQAHQYIGGLPANDDLCSWFALMQHHGVPTGFLDWTKSSYVALYFAFEEEPPEQCAVWAINLKWLEDRSRQILSTPAPIRSDLKKQAEYVNALLIDQTKQVVILPVNPSRLDSRMVAQQGIFLCKLYHEMYFSRVLMRMIMDPLTSPNQADSAVIIPPVVRRIVIAKHWRAQFLRALKGMNIHRASLFPGLDGFGQTLRLDLEIKGLWPW